jgi:hypothetical protein
LLKQEEYFISDGVLGISGERKESYFIRPQAIRQNFFMVAGSGGGTGGGGGTGSCAKNRTRSRLSGFFVYQGLFC